jgi:hypothetical protein
LGSGLETSPVARLMTGRDHPRPNPDWDCVEAHWTAPAALTDQNPLPNESYDLGRCRSLYSTEPG